MRYRRDESHKQSDGAIAWYAKWMGGPSLAKIENCQLANLAGDMRRTVTITSPDNHPPQTTEPKGN